MGTKNNNGNKPTIMMVAVQVIFAGMNIMLKLATHDGMDTRVVIAYRFIFGAVFMIPIAFFLERKNRPRFTWKVFIYAFLAGLFGGALGQNLYLASLVLTSATFAAAIINLVPAITFLVAVCLRMEKLGWNTVAGKAKVLGTILGIGGAMLFTFYKGPDITIWKTNVNLLEITSQHHHASPHKSAGANLGLGIILAMLSCISYSLWLIIQARAAIIYPSPLSFSALMVLMASITSFIFAICVQRDWSQWKLGWNIRLLAVSYSGILGSGIMFFLISLTVRMRGPLFTAIFNPLMLIIVGMAGSLVLQEDLYLGNLLGAILIIVSLYIVVWGKSKENKNITQMLPEENPMAAEDQDGEKQQREEY